ncbi:MULTISPECIES: maltokinase N-terminal cap-like domain-containing protein [unclassified Streptomyces]|uniref:maltokinase N-terminal cap-like domain-containing protein n=1 Tax=unclassified Streptomyces TaxID=2593676 RepID=UPI002E14A454|nr:1,4-alpha-glucan branching protein [Streptomyces sp. NBC_01197]WSS50861.1 1,4-alpha-glucan branching protein [Streptomyces sp. NBC_01180]
MSVIHRTTATPTKLELLAAWLPRQPWYLGGAGGKPELANAGGYRLDDPTGEVGIEFMLVTDASGDEPVTYQVPFSYRGAPLEGAGDEALIGTMEHGVLGERWAYDGTHDPVLVAQLVALMAGAAVPQDQNVSNTPDPTVEGHFTAPEHPVATGITAVADDEDGTDVRVQTANTAGPGLTLHINRVVRPGQSATAQDLGRVTGNLSLPDGTKVRAVYAVVRETGPAA